MLAQLQKKKTAIMVLVVPSFKLFRNQFITLMEIYMIYTLHLT